MNVIKGIDHIKRIDFIRELLILPVDDIEYMYNLEDSIKPKNFRAYYKVAICAKDNELQQLKEDKTTFTTLYNKCLKRKNNQSVAFNEAKKLIMQYRDLKLAMQTKIKAGKYSPAEASAINKAIEVYQIGDILNNV